jgi:transcriptional regulator with XRE-family HTH domain
LTEGTQHSKKESVMLISDRVRDLREQKDMSQGDMEKRTGLLRCYISRVENGHTIPTLHTLEKMARALGVPLYVLFYDGQVPPSLPKLVNRKGAHKILWGDSDKEHKTLNNFRRLLGQVKEEDQRLLLCLANKMAFRKISKARRRTK